MEKIENRKKDNLEWNQSERAGGIMLFVERRMKK